MNIFTNKNELIKKISLILVVITLFNVVLPLNKGLASDSSDEEVGGELFRPFAQLLCGFADLFVKGFQEYFVGDGDIKEGEEFYIEYGPAMIFAGKIPGLDANFVNPSTRTYTKTDAQKANKTYGPEGSKDALIDKHGTSALIEAGVEVGASEGKTETGEEIYKKYLSNKSELKNNGKTKIEGKLVEVRTRSVAGSIFHEVFIEGRGARVGSMYGSREQAVDATFELVIDELIEDAIEANPEDPASAQISAYLNTLKTSGSLILSDGSKLQVEQYTTAGTPMFKLLLYKVTDTKSTTITSAASQLQKTISSWYKTLRQVAVVGLLSVLVYIGIRMLMTSISQDKAKYRKMFTDWAVAMCLLFVLHYIMVFTMMAVEEVSNIFIKNEGTIIQTSSDGEYDVLMSSVRKEVGDYGNNVSFTGIFAQMIIYLVLVIFTAMFTWTYLKRLLYLAFFTMIAPLIALTYPLDKIKDGQAQAFSKWIKEYIYNALIPVVHLLLYYMFVGSSIDFAKDNPIYALAAIAFLIPAEKFFKSMFGFDKATAMGQLGAAASGALVMNAINKMKTSGGKSGSGGSSGGKEDSGTGYIPAPRQNRPPQRKRRQQWQWWQQR